LPFETKRDYEILAEVTLFGSDQVVREAVGSLQIDGAFFRTANAAIALHRRMSRPPSGDEAAEYERLLANLQRTRVQARRHLTTLGRITREEFEQPERLASDG
jgi:hypothetical protein